MSSPLFNVTDPVYAGGATGDGTTNDYAAIKAALDAAQASNGCLYFPAGVYKINTALSFTAPNNPSSKKISLKGDGPNVSVIKSGPGIDAINFAFAQSGVTQPWGVVIMDLGFQTSGAAGTAIKVSYGSPSITNDHFEPSVVLRNIEIRSDDTNYFANGVDITSAWNVCMTDCYISGSSYGGSWNSLSGNGIALHRLCANSHFVNCHCNFWSNGFYYDTGSSSTDPSTEGLFFTNCSMVAVKKGCFITGNPNNTNAPRVSGLTWVGGLIELRILGVTGGSAPFHLVNVWDIMISSVYMITESETSPPTTYAFFLDNCRNVAVVGCNIQAFDNGLLTNGTCEVIVISACTFVNCPAQVYFNAGTTKSRSFGNVGNNTPNEVDANGTNKIGWV